MRAFATRQDPTRAEYNQAFVDEAEREYPVIDAIEARFGYAVSRHKLEAAACVLACPVKANPPNWQHGRVLYAVARKYFADTDGPFTVLDIGTAKGFSALCLLWALQESGENGTVVSVDVIDPTARIYRNTVAEVDGLKTLAETLEPWPESSRIMFQKMEGLAWLNRYRASKADARIHFAFVDGKHSGAVVRNEASVISGLQKSGDISIFDDVHLADIWAAVRSLPGYEIERIDVLPNRAYALAVKR